MKENVKVMDQLLSESGKEPNQEQKKLYYMAVYQMLDEEGFTDNVQDYMDKGFKFIKMRPFKAYFMRKDESEKEELLEQLLKSEFLRKDNSRAFNILINLLALFISGKVDYRYCKAVVRKIPKYCYNKEGKILGNANGAMMNNFYSELITVPSDFDYAKLFDSEEIRFQFEELLTNSIAYASSIRKLTTRQKDAVEMVREWIPKAEMLTQEAKTEDYITSTETNHSQKNNCSEEAENISPAVSEEDGSLLEQVNSARKDVQDSNPNLSQERNPRQTEEKEQIPDNNYSVIKHLSDALDHSLHKINQIHSVVEKSNGKTDALIRTQQDYIDSLKKTIEKERENSGHIRQRNIELAEETRKLYEKIEELSKQLVEKEEENRSLSALLEVSSKEGDLKFKGEILKLTEKLRFEYEDYMSAKNIPMSIDLGENMRGQLGDVFSILKKAGLDIDC